MVVIDDITTSSATVKISVTFSIISFNIVCIKILYITAGQFRTAYYASHTPYPDDCIPEVVCVIKYILTSTPSLMFPSVQHPLHLPP